MKKSKNNIIDDWLSKNNNPKISKQVEREAKELYEEYLKDKPEVQGIEERLGLSTED